MADLGSTLYLVSGDKYIAKHVSGTVLDDAGNPARRDVMTVTTLNVITGTAGMIQKGTSRSDGTFELGCGFNSSVAVIAFDDDAGTSHNALVFDKVVPT